MIAPPLPRQQGIGIVPAARGLAALAPLPTAPETHPGYRRSMAPVTPGAPPALALPTPALQPLALGQTGAPRPPSPSLTPSILSIGPSFIPPSLSLQFDSGGMMERMMEVWSGGLSSKERSVRARGGHITEMGWKSGGGQLGEAPSLLGGDAGDGDCWAGRGRLPLNSLAMANPQGWQRVTGCP